MSVDAEIEEIRRTIYEIHRTLYKIDAQLDGAIEKVDTELGYFEQRLQSVADEASRICKQVVQTVSAFPNQQVYLAIIMVLDVLIWLVVGLLVYKAIVAWRNRHNISEKFVRKARGYPKNFPVSAHGHPDYVVWKQPQPDSPPKYDSTPTGGLLPVYSRIGTKDWRSDRQEGLLSSQRPLWKATITNRVSIYLWVLWVQKFIQASLP